MDALISIMPGTELPPVSTPSQKEINKYWLVGATPLDQGVEGACVGFGLTQCLLSERHFMGCTDGPRLLDGKFAREDIYYKAQEIDEFPGGEYPGANPRMGGTSLTAGLNVLKGSGMIKGFQWGYTLQDLILGIGYNGPAILVLPWFRSMYKVKTDMTVLISGDQVGYHCLIANAVDVKNEFFILFNSWGPTFGDKGRARISFSSMEYLFSLHHQIAFIET
jgi:hypothetical protein